MPADTVEIGGQAVCNTEAALGKRNDEADLRSKGKRSEADLCSLTWAIILFFKKTLIPSEYLSICLIPFVHDFVQRL